MYYENNKSEGRKNRYSEQNAVNYEVSVKGVF